MKDKGRTVGLSIAVLLAGAVFGGPAAVAGQTPDRGTTLVGLSAQRTERVGYTPGQRRTWAAGELHVVLVVSGRLTVEDGGGGRQVYTAGQSFAAGWQPYAATAPAGRSVQTVVTVHALGDVTFGCE